MIASSAVNGMPSSFLKNVVKIFFIALYILIVKLPNQKPREPHGWRGKTIKNNYTNCIPNEKENGYIGIRMWMQPEHESKTILT